MRVELKVPALGESISEVEIGDWKKAKGDSFGKDDALVALESEKATVDLPAPVSGVLSEVLKKTGETARVGEVIALLEEGSVETKAEAPKASSAQPDHAPSGPQVRVMPAAQRVLHPLLEKTGDRDDAKRQALLALEVAPSFVRAQELLLRLVEPRQ